MKKRLLLENVDRHLGERERKGSSVWRGQGGGGRQSGEEGGEELKEEGRGRDRQGRTSARREREGERERGEADTEVHRQQQACRVQHAGWPLTLPSD